MKTADAICVLCERTFTSLDCEQYLRLYPKSPFVTIVSLLLLTAICYVAVYRGLWEMQLGVNDTKIAGWCRRWRWWSLVGAALLTCFYCAYGLARSAVCQF